MTLEAVVYQQDHLGHSDDNKDLCSLLENWGWWDFKYLPNQDQDQQVKDHDHSPDHEACQHNDEQDQDYRSHQDHSPPCMVPSFTNEPLAAATTSSSTRPKRRRARSRKNWEDIENQRITHIAVERNRRKQMNEYLSVLKSLMPDSYSQRGDQASIVGGAINVVKELEQNLHCLRANKMQKVNNSPLPFGDFFSFPQYSTTAKPMVTGDSSLCGAASKRPYTEASRVADVEVTMVESHANLKIRSRKRPKQLLKIVSGMQELRLNILHLNVITADRFALYSLSIKVEDDSELNSADEIATTVHKLLSKIDEEASSS